MIVNNNNKKIFNKVQSIKKEELSTEKVELDAVDTARMVVSQVKQGIKDRLAEEAFDKVVKAELDFKKAVNEYKDTEKLINNLDKKIEQEAKKDGMSFRYRSALEDLDDAKNYVSSKLRQMQKNISKLKGVNI